MLIVMDPSSTVLGVEKENALLLVNSDSVFNNAPNSAGTEFPQ